MSHVFNLATRENRRRGGTPPNTLMLFDVDFLRAHSYDSKTVGLFEKEKASSFGNFIFWGFSTHGFGGSPHFMDCPLIFSSIFLVLGASDEMVRGVGPSKKVAHFEGMM